jgi:hypothetical protein
MTFLLYNWLRSATANYIHICEYIARRHIGMSYLCETFVASVRSGFAHFSISSCRYKQRQQIFLAQYGKKKLKITHNNPQ